MLSLLLLLFTIALPPPSVPCACPPNVPGYFEEEVPPAARLRACTDNSGQKLWTLAFSRTSSTP